MSSSIRSCQRIVPCDSTDPSAMSPPPDLARKPENSCTDRWNSTGLLKPQQFYHWYVVGLGAWALDLDRLGSELWIARLLADIRWRSDLNRQRFTLWSETWIVQHPLWLVGYFGNKWILLYPLLPLLGYYKYNDRPLPSDSCIPQIALNLNSTIKTSLRITCAWINY